MSVKVQFLQVMMEVSHFKTATTQYFVTGFETLALAITHPPDTVILSSTEERDVQETQLSLPRFSLYIWVAAIFSLQN